MTDGLQRVAKLYVDANIFIYFIEGQAAFQDLAARLFQLAHRNSIPLVTSEMSIAECLRGAYRSSGQDLAASYKELFGERTGIELVPVALPILDAAARLGAAHGLKLVDALHVASAVQTGCDAFLTNDNRIRLPDSLRRIQFSITPPPLL